MASSESTIRRWDQTGIPLLLARLLLGGVFIFMGLSKLGGPIAFLQLIRQYQLVPESPAIYLNGMAIVLPWLEIICGLWLVLGSQIRGAAAVIGLMLLVFTPVVFVRAMAIHNSAGTPFFEIEFDCGCGAGNVIIWKKLLENIALFPVALVALFSRSRRFCLATWLTRGRDKDKAAFAAASQDAPT